jgi:hypothetical protein
MPSTDGIPNKETLVKSRSVILAILLILLLIGAFASGQSLAAQSPQATLVATPTPAVLPVERGANAPLLCGAIAILVIIVGGVVWNARLRKTELQDH